MSFEFDEAKHEYKYGGAVVPSVTQAIGIMQDFSAIPKGTLEVAQQWGTMVHSYLEIYDQGNLNTKTADSRMLPIITEWEKIKAAHNWVVPLLSEQIYYSKKFGYAGKLDRLFKTDKIYTIVDFKTGASQFSNIQMAGYLHLIRENYAPLNRVERMMIHFDQDGKAHSEVYPMSSFKKDFSDFLCVLRVHQLMRRKK